MEIDIRAVRRLRESAGARAAIAPMVEALCRSDADLAGTRVVCDWIQYRANFRDTGRSCSCWPAGPVSACASRRYTQRPASNVKTLTVQVRD